MNRRIPQHQFRHNRQAGFILFIALAFLVIMTFLGVTVLRMNTMDERMTSNLRDEHRCAQGAEAALKRGEGFIQYLPDEDEEEGTPNGDYYKLYSRNTTLLGDLTQHNDTWWRENANELVLGIRDLDNPFYLQQYLGFMPDNSQDTESESGTLFYLITARCNDGGRYGSEVILQSVFTRKRG